MSFWRRQTLTLLSAMTVLSLVMFIPLFATAQDEGSAVTVQYNGHLFDLPRSLADGVSAFIIDEATEHPNGGDSSQPPRTEFRLQIYTDTIPAPSPAGWVNVYDVSDLEGSAAYEQYERLRVLLDETPDLDDQETLPTLYPYQQSALPADRYTAFFVNASYLETAAYSGITFIYGRVIHMGNHQPVLFYRIYFEGISSDQQRYLSAQIEGPPAFTESLEGVTDPGDYVAQAQALFHQPADEAIIAWLSQADVLFSSFDYSAQS